jgi:transcriptional regulator with XRE-family HTH domain
MPLNSDLSALSCQEFCLALKAARERKGITLAEIADQTKIPASTFAALERNDLRRWPKGLFRRAFFRDYARLIGLPADEACAEFVRLFPDGTGADAAKAPEEAAATVSEAKDVRLVLDETWHGPRGSLLSRLLAAPIDAAAVILAAFTLAFMAGVDRAAATAVIALAYFSLATALLGQSPATWAIAKRRSIFEALSHVPAAIAAAWRRADVFGRAAVAAAAPEAAEEDEMRPWVTDAHRVGPPRLRVRIKVS